MHQAPAGQRPEGLDRDAPQLQDRGLVLAERSPGPGHQLGRQGARQGGRGPVCRHEPEEQLHLERRGLLQRLPVRLLQKARLPG